MPMFLHKNQLLNYSMLLLFFVGLLSCSEDEGGEEPTVNPLVGTYTFASATFIDEITITLNGQTSTFPSNTDATAFVSDGLLGAAPCADQNNAALELRENNEGYFVCIDEDVEEKAGTWEVNEAQTEISIIISGIAPIPVTLLIEDYTLEDGVLSGRVGNFPLVKNNQYPIGATLPAEAGGGLNLQTTPVDLEFNKVE